ncbi:MAG TPA: SPFH domain-containing protein [Vicinamibacterales bacterium]|nr:SPFH domain-containing protein [Vicinamibacterales bacterium]
MIRERSLSTISGWLAVPVWFTALALSLWQFVVTAQAVDDGVGNPLRLVAWIVVMVFLIFLLKGFFVVNPNEARVLTLFGRYSGSVKRDGFHWSNPLFRRRAISLKIRNFESAQIKVNDLEGNPIEIAAIVVWRVVETAEALFEVDNYEHYVKVQTEAAVRNLAMHYPYDAYVDGHMSLRSNTTEIAELMKAEVQARLNKAGVEVLEARINHLAYAPEIAAAMLQRQQAGAIIAARQRIVEGAVGMVEMALDLLSKRDVVTLDNDRKAAMVSNLLVVLCGDRNTQPVVNTGTIYQ